MLVLAELRAIMGDKPFDKFMDEFGRAHAGRPVSSAAFFEAAEKAHGKPLGDLKAAWLNGDALSKLSADVRGSQGLGPVLVGRFVRAAARQGADRLRNASPRPILSARPPKPCSASWPAAGPISPFPSRPTPT